MKLGTSATELFSVKFKLKITNIFYVKYVVML